MICAAQVPHNKALGGAEEGGGVEPEQIRHSRKGRRCRGWEKEGNVGSGEGVVGGMPGRGKQQRGDRRGTREGMSGPREGRRRGRDGKGMTRKEDEGEMVGFGMRQVQPLALLGRGTLRKKRRGCTRGGEKCWGNAHELVAAAAFRLLFSAG